MSELLIVGGGIAGLTAGIYAQYSGIQTTILEQNRMPGGNCTGWKRKGYYFEGSLHWLTGTTPNDGVNKLWKDVNVLNDRVGKVYPELISTTFDGGQEVYLYADPARTREHFLSVAPEDASAIERLYRDTLLFKNMIIPVFNATGVKLDKKEKLTSWTDYLRMTKCAPRLISLNKIDCDTYAAQFSNTGIRNLIRGVIYSPGYSSVALLTTLGGYARGDGVYLEGGSNGMIDRMLSRFYENGGKIEFGAKVQKVLHDDRSVHAVSFKDGTTKSCKALIVASDTARAVKDLFDSPPKDKWIKQMLDYTPSMCSFVCLGLKKNLKGMPKSLMIPLKKPLQYMGRSMDMICLWQYADYPYAPSGCTSLCVSLLDGTKDNTYKKWKEAKERGEYTKEKQRLGEQVKNVLEDAFPDWIDYLSVLDVATPLTYERYCGTEQGSWMSNMVPGGKTMGFYSGTVKELPNLFFSGQRLYQPGGMPSALITGRRAAQYACNYLNKSFVSP